MLTALQRKLSWKGTVEAAENTLKSTAMVMWTIFGANIFVGLYVMVGGGNFVSELLLGSGLGKWGIIIVMQLILLFLGCCLSESLSLMNSTLLRTTFSSIKKLISA